jgi:hypothetical protein
MFNLLPWPPAIDVVSAIYGVSSTVGALAVAFSDVALVAAGASVLVPACCCWQSCCC